MGTAVSAGESTPSIISCQSAAKTVQSVKATNPDNRIRGFPIAFKLEQGRYEEAIAEFDEAIRLDPTLAPAYSNRGGAYSNLGQYQRAIEDYDEAIRLDPQHAPAYSDRGDAYTKLGRHEQSIEDFDEAILLDPQLAIAYADRGVA